MNTYYFAAHVLGLIVAGLILGATLMSWTDNNRYRLETLQYHELMEKAAALCGELDSFSVEDGQIRAGCR